MGGDQVRAAPNPWDAPADVEARRLGFRSDYEMRFVLALRSYADGDSSLLDEFEASCPVLDGMRRGVLRGNTVRVYKAAHG